MTKNAFHTWTRSGATRHSADSPIIFLTSEKNDLNVGTWHTKTGNSGQVLPTKHSQSKSTPSRRFNNSFMDETDLANTPVAICVCILWSTKGFYLQHVCAAVSKLANHTHIY